MLLQGFVEQGMQAQEMFAGIVQAVALAGVAQVQGVFVHQRQAVDVPAVLQEAVQATAKGFHAPRQVAQEGVSVFGES
ncbi:MAG: hypothetical protein A2X76_08550 [Lysobacterales bacterium GWF1_69_6]|nr:MAG: hypothetical protein A2X76_08550 [Xanthomonadales bacterium GWF1_69_6]